MKVEYKCDYCDFKTEDINIIHKHSESCGGNPKNMNCGICEYFKTDYFGMERECEKEFFKERTLKECKHFSYYRDKYGNKK